MLRSPFRLLLALALSGCNTPTRVEVKALVPDLRGQLAPAPGVALLALPYDRDSLIAALDARAGSPRPSDALLDTLYSRLRAPFGVLAAVSDSVAALQDSAARLKQALDSLPRESPQYRAGYSAFMDVAAARTAAEKRQAGARRALDRARAAATPRIDSVRALLTAWEDSARADYEKHTSELLRRAVVQAVADTTNAEGAASLSLPRGRDGRWWIYARTWDASDPNAEWYWNVPVTGDSVVLDTGNARKRIKY